MENQTETPQKSKHRPGQRKGFFIEDAAGTRLELIVEEKAIKITVGDLLRETIILNADEASALEDALISAREML